MEKQERFTYIVPVTKSPHQTGRIGPRRFQDWYRGAVKAREYLGKYHPARILVLSDVHVNGEKHEADLYHKALTDAGVEEHGIEVIKEEQETIGQIDRLYKIAEEENAKLVIISTFLHYLRVAWLVWRKRTYRSGLVEVTHRAAFGIPRPREVITDVILWFVFPVIDLLGGRLWFQRKVSGRRVSGAF